MAETADTPESVPKGRRRLPLLLGVLGALLLGGAAFHAVRTGMILAPGASGPGAAGDAPADPAGLADITFIPVDTVTVSLGPESGGRHLRFTAQLEVEKSGTADVATLMPRIIDVLNGYLRAVPLRDLNDPGAMARLRAQMLRRVQIVTGEGRVRDLLVSEFIVN